MPAAPVQYGQCSHTCASLQRAMVGPACVGGQRPSAHSPVCDCQVGWGWTHCQTETDTARDTELPHS